MSKKYKLEIVEPYLISIFGFKNLKVFDQFDELHPKITEDGCKVYFSSSNYETARKWQKVIDQLINHG